MEKLKTGTKLRFEFDATVDGYDKDGWLTINDGKWFHKIWPDAVPNVTTTVMPPYEVGELYRDTDGDVFTYEGGNDWLCVKAAYIATQVGATYFTDYLNQPIVKLVPES